MTAAQLRLRRVVRIAAALTLGAVLLPHWLAGDGLWLLTVLAVAFWGASCFVRGPR